MRVMTLRSSSVDGLTRNWFIDFLPIQNGFLVKHDRRQKAIVCPTGFMADWRGMRVVVDATPLLVRSAGVKNYLYHWILHLRRAAGTATVWTCPSMERWGARGHEASLGRPRGARRGLGEPRDSPATR